VNKRNDRDRSSFFFPARKRERERTSLLQSNCYMSKQHVTNIERFMSKCKNLTQEI